MIMRICSPQIGLYANSSLGGGVHDFEILKGLSQLGVEIHIPLMMTLNCAKEKNWTIYPIPLKRMYKLGALLTNVVFFILVTYLGLNRRFDILRIPYPDHAGYMGYFAKKLFKLKTVATYHHLEPENQFKNYFKKRIANSFSHIIAVSEFTKKQIIETYGVPSEKISVIYNGVDKKYFTFREQDISAYMDTDKDNINLLFVGSLITRKNLFLLIDVFKYLYSDSSNLQLIICGSGYPHDNYEVRLKEYVKNLRLDKNIIFTGMLPEEQKIALYQYCDIYVHPSLIEGFGLSVAEAMASGKPVVASNAGSLPEIIENGKTGFLADPKDVRDFSDKIKILLKNKKMRLGMGAKGRERILKYFTWEKATQETLAVFKRVYESNICLS